MIIKNTIKTELSCEDGKRFYLRIEWNKELPCAMVIMLMAGYTDGISFDRSTNLCISNLVRLGYGSCYIVNLFSSDDITSSEDDENLKAIKTSLSKADDIIYAVGTGKDGNKKAVQRKKEVLKMLQNITKKIYCISDGQGRLYYHPLCPRVHEWILTEMDVATFIDGKMDGQVQGRRNLNEELLAEKP